MNDMSATIIAKSDQINAADLVGSTFTGIIREVNIKASVDDQPVSIFFEGEKKAFRPCKGVRRLLVKAWGPDANAYIGKGLELFCDPTVTWAGKEEGGIRVSRMSHIESAFVFAMRTSRTATKPYQIKPLQLQTQEPAPRQQGKQTPQQWVDEHLDVIDAAASIEELDAIEQRGARAVTKLAADHADLHAEVTHAYQMRREALSVENRPDEDYGEGFADDAADRRNDLA